MNNTSKKKVYVGNLSFGTTEEGLRTHFSQFGAIEDLVVIKQPDGRSKGFGFITFATEQEAEAALAMEGKELDGRTLRVNIAKEREAGDRGGSGDRGGRGGFGAPRRSYGDRPSHGGGRDRY